jgi:hypothetical protein
MATSLVRLAYVEWRHRRVRQFLAGAQRSSQVQQDVLLAKLRKNADSDFGRAHGFASIRTLAEFRRQMPLADYEYHRPYIERVKQGEIAALFGSDTRLLMFSMTSGSTGNPKFIPITEDFLREYRKSWNTWGVNTYRDHKDLLTKKSLQLSSDWQQFHTPGGVPCGGMSGLAAETAPLVSRPIFLLPRALMKVHDHAAKQYAALRLAIAARNLGIIITANPATLIELARLADAERDNLIRDIADGTLTAPGEVPHDVRTALRRRFAKRDRARARELERIVEATGSLHPRDYWPELSVLAVWTGGSVGAYLPRVRDYYGDAVFRDHGLSASEGRMTTPLADGTSSGVLDYLTHFYEFIPEAEHGKENPIVLSSHELEQDQNYFIVLTTWSGLYRYQIQDVVRCTGHVGETPLLEFLNKGAYYSSVAGEKLSEYQVVSAVKQAFADLSLPLEDFTLAPIWDEPPGYVLLLEPGPHSGRETELAARVEAELIRLNCEYENRLETHRLKPLVILEAPRGVWARFREERRRRSGNAEQFKHPYLTSDLEFVDKLLSSLHAEAPTITPDRRTASAPVRYSPSV